MSRTNSYEPQVERGIYLGDRGDAFRKFIRNIFEKNGLGNVGSSKMGKSYKSFLTTPENMELYGMTFTSDAVDTINNYQFYEQLGDLTVNKFIINYMYERFPQLKCSEGVKVVARLRIIFGSKDSLSEIADTLGFWPFITATIEQRKNLRRDLLEDTFEAFIGVTEFILDNALPKGTGWSFVYRLLQNIFDKLDISIKYEKLYDAKTRLKEVFDMLGNKIGNISYSTMRPENSDQWVSKITLYEGSMLVADKSGKLKPSGGKPKLIATGYGNNGTEAEIDASEKALTYMAKIGHKKVENPIYAKFENKQNDTITTERDVLKAIDGDWRNINNLYQLRGKSKYQNKTDYKSTVLAHYAHKRDIAGMTYSLIKGANPNIPDSEEQTVADIVLTGLYEPAFVKAALQLIERAVGDKGKIKLHEKTWEVYYTKYNERDPGNFFEDLNNKLDLIN